MNKIIITKGFKNQFQKKFKKYCFDFEWFVDLLKETRFYNQESPFFKFKITIEWVDLRGIVVKFWEKVIPIFFVLKSNKQYGQNLVLNSQVQAKVEHRYKKFKEDIESGEYNSY